VRILGKRIKYKIGDVFTFELEKGLKAVGRVIKRNLATVFVVIYKIKPFKDAAEIDLNSLAQQDALVMEWSYDTALKKGMWEIIGNIPVEENFEMPYFSTDDGAGKYYLIKGGDTYSGVGDLIVVSKEEAQKAYSFGISNEIALPKGCIYRFRQLNML
jgi:hypothetical protein